MATDKTTSKEAKLLTPIGNRHLDPTMVTTNRDTTVTLMEGGADPSTEEDIREVETDQDIGAMAEEVNLVIGTTMVIGTDLKW